ncbi:hypothetical protein QT711_18075 [Sporosarcina saromensis]|uniref:Uncharacterized protein n=1 Tax=Sporosarcina saromensis TaxID=359365 RepID=A0ABU4GHK9_9BACL|nr:hypothetical protein [Sporosarcina saromensis]MDW0115072.1 hypothetical protein [Sporosarcina saromensis]
MGKVKTRKVRSDKKRDVKPTISIELKDCVYRLSYITNTPVQHIVEQICESGIGSRRVIEYLAPHFRRTVRLNNTLFMGGVDRPLIPKRDPGVTQRISTRFNQVTFENINTLAYALDVTPSRATGVLLDATIHSTDFLNVYVRGFLNQQLDQRRMQELKKVLRFINNNNSSNEHYSWFVFLSNFYDEIKDTANTVSNSIYDFLDKWKSY